MQSKLFALIVAMLLQSFWHGAAWARVAVVLDGEGHVTPWFKAVEIAACQAATLEKVWSLKNAGDALSVAELGVWAPNAVVRKKLVQYKTSMFEANGDVKSAYVTFMDSSGNVLSSTATIAKDQVFHVKVTIPYVTNDALGILIATFQLKYKRAKVNPVISMAIAFHNLAKANQNALDSLGTGGHTTGGVSSCAAHVRQIFNIDGGITPTPGNLPGAVDKYLWYNGMGQVHTDKPSVYPSGAAVFYGFADKTCPDKYKNVKGVCTISANVLQYGHVAYVLDNGKAVSVKGNGVVIEHDVLTLYADKTSDMYLGYVLFEDFIDKFKGDYGD